jgi:hypothetical protein
MQPFERAKLLSKFAELLEKPDQQRAIHELAQGGYITRAEPIIFNRRQRQR